MNRRSIIATILVFLGCGCNVYFLEHLIRYASGAGNIITFCQFCVITIQGFILTADFGRKKPTVPISQYAVMVILFFLVQVTNNLALNFKISMPLHMIFRSGSLLANMALAIIILKRQYSRVKFIAVAMITMGILLCTLSSVTSETSSTPGDSLLGYLWWVIGISLLLFALVVSARLGIMQEEIATKFGKYPDETLFYSHALPLPFFVFLSKDIYEHAVLFSNSEPYAMPLINLSVPIMWLYLIGNLVTQYICIRSVYVLTVEYSSLTVTLIVTLRKFLSLIVSIFYFQNPFTVYHWVGTSLVFIGTFLFVDIYKLVTERTQEAKDKKSD